MPRNVCPRCNLPFGGTGTHNPRGKTRDHILPASWGAGDVIHGDVENITFVCLQCNNFRAVAFDCWAMAACIDAVRPSLGMTRMQVFHLWKLGPALQKHKAKASYRINNRLPSQVHGIEPRLSSHARKARSAEAVRMARMVNRLGVDAFMWPADTLEAQLHNFQVLVSAGYKP